MQALPGVHAVERLVEQQHGRVVHQRGGHLDPLLHALGVGRRSGGPWRSSISTTAMRPRGGRLGVRQAVEPGVGQHELPAGEEVVHRLALGDQPDRPVDRLVRHAGAPSRVTVPAEGARKPAIMWIRVDLPAPLGPSSPVTPGPIVIVTSLTATTLPNHRETPGRWTTVGSCGCAPSGSGASRRPYAAGTMQRR